MPFTCSVDPGARLGALKFEGVVVAGEVQQAIVALVEHENWRSGFDALWDATAIRQLLVDVEDLDRIQRQYELMRPRIGRGRTAFVVPRDVDHLIAQLMIKRLHSSGRERRAFRQLDNAYMWLRQEESTA